MVNNFLCKICRMRKKLLLLCFLSLILSCGDFFTGEGKFENTIGKKIRETCVKKEKCSIRIYESTWFEWDKLIVFSGGFTNIDVNNVLEKDYFIEKNYFKENKFGNSKTIVFLKDKEIVYSEENFREAEGYRNGDLYFYDIDTSKGYQVFKKDSEFHVERNAIQADEYEVVK